MSYVEVDNDDPDHDIPPLDDMEESQKWENLDEDTEDEIVDDVPFILSLRHRHLHDEESTNKLYDGVDVETGETEIATEEEEEDTEESLRAFYDDFAESSRRTQAVVPPPMRHFSFSELSNESSPLLNPLKRMPKGTPSKIWFHRLWRWYDQRLRRRPVVTKAITAGIIVSLGDVVGQCMEMSSSGTSTFDVVRLARFCSMGMFLQAPVTHYYYSALDHYLPPTPDNPWTLVTFVKLLIDQTTYAPAFLLSVFLYLGILEGDSWTTIWAQLREEYVSTMIANWKLWIPATLLNMAYVPPQFRVLYCNVIFFGWSIFLSLIMNETPPTNGR